MLTFSIYLFTAIMVIDCLFLVLLVLVQLPKKEAGMGQAFGGAATDALLGAGSGNVLTKITRWSAGIFFGLAILLTVLGNVQTTRGGGSTLQKNLSKNLSTTPLPAGPTNTAAAPAGSAITLNLPGTTNTAAPTNK
jgi:preprotein translocase subunit SecG